MNWFEKLCAAYPRDFNANSPQRGFWVEEFRKHDPSKVAAAVNGWTHDNRRPPTIADIHERIRANADHSAARTTQCGSCDNGWTWVDLTGVGTVTRCRNGCLPRVQGAWVPADDDAVDPRSYTAAILRDRPKPKKRRR